MRRRTLLILFVTQLLFPGVFPARGFPDVLPVHAGHRFSLHPEWGRIHSPDPLKADRPRGGKAREARRSRHQPSDSEALAVRLLAVYRSYASAA